MEWMDKVFMGVFLVFGTMWIVKNICKLEVFKDWGMIKHFVLVVGLLIGSFYLKYFLMCYAGIDEDVMWMRVLGNQILFPRYCVVFGLVNLLLPGVFVLFFRGIEGDEPFWQSSYGATSCIALAGFGWHFIYMYPEADESIAFFSAITITIMILYGYRLAIKREMILKPQTSIEVIFSVFVVVLFLSIAARYAISPFGKFYVWYTFRRMGCGNVLAWSYILLTISYTIVMWYLWNKCKKFPTRVFALPAVLMPSFRWGYAILMNFGILPNIDNFVGIPFDDNYIVYDLMCIGILLMCVMWKEGKGKMLRVRTPIDKVSMVIEEEVLAKIIDERACGNERAKMQMKRFFYSTAEEIEDRENDKGNK